MQPSLNFTSESCEQTIEIGRALGRVLAPGDVLALVGPLGAGKTQFVKGLAAGLGVGDSRMVTSPTFVLVNEYSGRAPLYHLDAYRLDRDEDFDALGFAEMCESGAVVVVEWADRVRRAMPSNAVWIEFALAGDSARRLTMCASDEDALNRLAKAASAR